MTSWTALQDVANHRGITHRRTPVGGTVRRDQGDRRGITHRPSDSAAVKHATNDVLPTLRNFNGCG